MSSRPRPPPSVPRRMREASAKAGKAAKALATQADTKSVSPQSHNFMRNLNEVQGDDTTQSECASVASLSPHLSPLPSPNMRAANAKHGDRGPLLRITPERSPTSSSIPPSNKTIASAGTSASHAQSTESDQQHAVLSTSTTVSSEPVKTGRKHRLPSGTQSLLAKYMKRFESNVPSSEDVSTTDEENVTDSENAGVGASSSMDEDGRETQDQQESNGLNVAAMLESPGISPIIPAEAALAQKSQNQRLSAEIHGAKVHGQVPPLHIAETKYVPPAVPSKYLRKAEALVTSPINGVGPSAGTFASEPTGADQLPSRFLQQLEQFNLACEATQTPKSNAKEDDCKSQAQTAQWDRTQEDDMGTNSKLAPAVFDNASSVSTGSRNRETKHAMLLSGASGSYPPPMSSSSQQSAHAELGVARGAAATPTLPGQKDGDDDSSCTSDANSSMPDVDAVSVISDRAFPHNFGHHRLRMLQRSMHKTHALFGTCQCLVTFRVAVRTNFGDHVRVVGNCPALGSWQPQDAPQLFTDAQTFPLWYATVRVQHPLQAMPLEYKYVIVREQQSHNSDQDGSFGRWNMVWESSISNRLAWLSRGRATLADGYFDVMPGPSMQVPTWPRRPSMIPSAGTRPPDCQRPITLGENGWQCGCQLCNLTVESWPERGAVSAFVIPCVKGADGKLDFILRGWSTANGKREFGGFGGRVESRNCAGGGHYRVTQAASEWLVVASGGLLSCSEDRLLQSYGHGVSPDGVNHRGSSGRRVLDIKVEQSVEDGANDSQSCFIAGFFVGFSRKKANLKQLRNIAAANLSKQGSGMNSSNRSARMSATSFVRVEMQDLMSAASGPFSVGEVMAHDDQGPPVLVRLSQDLLQILRCHAGINVLKRMIESAAEVDDGQQQLTAVPGHQHLRS